MHDENLEQMILGSALYDPKNIVKITTSLEPRHFYVALHQRIYSKIIDLQKASVIPNEITLRQFIIKDQLFESRPEEGRAYLKQLVVASSALFDIQSGVETMRNLFTMRHIKNTCENATVAIEAANSLEAGQQIVDSLTAQLKQAYRNTNKHTLFVVDLITKAKEEIEKAIENNKKNQTTGLPSKLPTLDVITDGFREGELIILAARPSMGKTALATKIMLNIANLLKEEANKKKKNVLMVSLEMPTTHIIKRAASVMSGVSMSSITKDYCSQDDFHRFYQALEQLKSYQIAINDEPDTEIDALCAQIRNFVNTHDVVLIVIDYLQLISLPKPADRITTVTMITKKLKLLARELNTPILTLSQLSRATESREGKKPQLSDLRDSGSIEQDADMVLLLYREAYYLARQKPDKDKNQEKFLQWEADMSRARNLAEVFVAKNRNGPVGEAKLFFDQNTTGFN